MDLKRRYRYVREFFADDDLVAVYAINDGEIGAAPYPNGWEQWLNEFEDIWMKATVATWKKRQGPKGWPEGDEFSHPMRCWYAGDPNYVSDLIERGETAILVDRTSNNPISATKIRENPIKHWDKITFPFRRIFSHNILICGTASEGKTTLTADLGKYFNAPYSYEWPRQYMEESNVSDWELDCADYMAFLQGQYDLNKKLINSPANNGIFFADTDSMVTRMYAEYYAKDETCALTEADFEKIEVAADEYTRKSRWDKIFLLAPHGVFVDDHTRYMAHSGMKERQELFDILCWNMMGSGNWDKVEILTGNYYENFMTVVKYVNGVIENGKN